MLDGSKKDIGTGVWLFEVRTDLTRDRIPGRGSPNHGKQEMSRQKD